MWTQANQGTQPHMRERVLRWWRERATGELHLYKREPARLDPTHANELVFLHEAKSDLKKYDDSHAFVR
jgi:hypothetical protein